MNVAVKERSLVMESVNPVKGLEFLSTVCSSIAKSGALAKALCSLDQSKIGQKFAFAYTHSLNRGPDLTGILLATMKGWIAIDQKGNVLGVDRRWSGTDLYNNDDFHEQLRRVILAGLPAMTFGKLLDMACTDNAKATALWTNLRKTIDEGLDAMRPDD